MAVSVTVAEGVSVSVVAGTVVKTVSVSVVMVVTDMVSVMVSVSVKVAVEVTSSVAWASPRQPHAVEIASQAKPVRSAVGAASQDGLGAGVMVGVIREDVVKITEEAVGPAVGWIVELLEMELLGRSGVEILEDAVTPAE